MTDPYFALAARELAEEQAIDLNRETAAEYDGIVPSNVAIWTQYRSENEDGTTNINATCNALCGAVASLREAITANQNSTNGLLSDMRQLREENEQLRESIRIEAEEGSVGWGLASDHQAERDALQAENERLREQLTNVSLYLISVENGWTDAKDREALRKLLPGSVHSTPDSRAILARVVSGYVQRAA